MDQIESAALRDDMERLHMVSREALLQAAGVAARLAEEALHVRAERARQTAAIDRQAWETEREYTRAYQDALAAVWETRLRDPRWFADAPIQELMDTWATADAWAQAGDSRAIAARERLRLQVRGIGLDPDLVQTTVDARDTQALTDLLDAPAGPPRGPGHNGPEHRGPGPRGPAARQATGRGREVLDGADLEAMSDLVRASMDPDPATAILADPQWPRVAAQLHRAQDKIASHNAAHPDGPVDLSRELSTLQSSRPVGALRSPAGWMIWQLHQRTAAHGVQLSAQSRPHGTGVHPRRSAPSSTARTARSTPRIRREPERGS